MPENALRQRLAGLRVPADRISEYEIKALVWDFVDDRKGAGWPPERVIVAVKQIARDAGLKPSARLIRRDADLTAPDDFLVAMVGWCIERYFDPAGQH